MFALLRRLSPGSGSESLGSTMGVCGEGEKFDVIPRCGFAKFERISGVGTPDLPTTASFIAIFENELLHLPRQMHRMQEVDAEWHHTMFQFAVPRSLVAPRNRLSFPGVRYRCHFPHSEILIRKI